MTEKLPFDPDRDTDLAACEREIAAFISERLATNRRSAGAIMCALASVLGRQMGRQSPTKEDVNEGLMMITKLMAFEAHKAFADESEET